MNLFHLVERVGIEGHGNIDLGIADLKNNTEQEKLSEEVSRLHVSQIVFGF